MNKKVGAIILIGICFQACAMAGRAPIRIEERVDLQRFMGPWYVIANIPTFVEKGAHNAMESYKLNEDGTIATTFTFRKDSFDGKLKTHTPKGFVRDKKSNAVWGMQFIWPFKGDFRIVYLDKDYTQTIVGREKRDYLWIMARNPQLSEVDYQKLVKISADEGYDISKIQKVPQKW